MSIVSDILGQIVSGIVDEPEAVSLTEEVGNNTISINIKTASKDAGKVIGKEAKTVRALRVIARAIGAKLQKNVNVLVVD
jgi:predicted RNA-binding protein YlqC (UPF0109 family)